MSTLGDTTPRSIFEIDGCGIRDLCASSRCVRPTRRRAIVRIRAASTKEGTIEICYQYPQTAYLPPSGRIDEAGLVRPAVFPSTIGGVGGPPDARAPSGAR